MRRRQPLNEAPTRDIGPYALAHRIAIGGMAEVYRALWPQAAGGDRAVVIKRMLPALLDDPEQRAMFQHEAELGLRIDHPNVVAALDHGVDDGAPYLVLEYVFGVDLWRLSRFMKSSGLRIRIPTAVWIARELLAGLSAVHQVTDRNGIPLHIVHRDVSPSNIFLSVHGDVKLGDLGIARASMRDISRHGARGARAKGKIGYLPPEEVIGSSVDQRGDVFSAAVVLAEVLMGGPLFAGGTPIGVLLAIRDGDVSGFRAIVADLPPLLGEVVLRALARDPGERTETAEEFREQLARFVDEPSDQLASEVGALVVGALDDEANPDRTSLAQTVEADPEQLEPAVLRRGIPSTPVPPDSGPVYHVVHEGADNRTYTLAALIKALTTGKLLPDDQVRVGNADPVQLLQVPELAAHLPASNRTPTISQRIKMAETGELFELSERSIVHILLEARLMGDSGLLFCEKGKIRKEVYLEKGTPCFVTSNVPGELLGESLVSNGVIDRAELDMALATMPRFEGRLGETLVALGLMDPVMLVQSIAVQVHEKLIDLFTWQQGHAALYRGVERPQRAFPLDLDAWAILEKGMRRRIDRHLEDPRLGTGGSGHALTRTGKDPSDMELPDSLLEIWTACGGPRTLKELEGMGGSASRTQASVGLLLAMGLLSWRAG